MNKQERKAKEKNESNEKGVSLSGSEIHSGSTKSWRFTSKKGKMNTKEGDMKCRKKSIEFLLGKIDTLRHKNHVLNRKIHSTGSCQPPNKGEMLSPLEMDLDIAYRHLKNDSDSLKARFEEVQSENNRLTQLAADFKRENEILQEDVSLMKNLVYKLNLELERYQTGGKKLGNLEDMQRIDEKLPKNYEKNFLRPLLPLLIAYAEALKQKDEIIEDLESEYKKFNVAFNDIFRENERLYGELEKKFSDSCERRFNYNEMKLLKRDLEMAKEENGLLVERINLEKEKLIKIHSTLKIKAEEASKEKEGFKSTMEECKSDLLVMRGKYTFLKQEFERLKMDNDERIPLAVHSASINECRKLFDDLKGEYENEKSRLFGKIKELENTLSRRDKEEVKWTEERTYLEKSNFSQNFEIETLMARIRELEDRLSKGEKGVFDREKTRREVNGLKRQLGNANQNVKDLSRSLATTRKKLQKAMKFAEEIVQEQESLLLQLHQKQKENDFMTAQFGNLRNQLKTVEKGAQESLNSVEEKMNNLESENNTLIIENQKLEKLLAEKEDLIRKFETTSKT